MQLIRRTSYYRFVYRQEGFHPVEVSLRERVIDHRQMISTVNFPCHELHSQHVGLRPGPTYLFQYLFYPRPRVVMDVVVYFRIKIDFLVYYCHTCDQVISMQRQTQYGRAKDIFFHSHVQLCGLYRIIYRLLLELCIS